MTKSIYVPEYNLAYTEGKKPVYIQLYVKDNDLVEIGFCVADSPEEALFIGATIGRVISNVRLIDLFGKLKEKATMEKAISK
jgi:hypothetical protein